MTDRIPTEEARDLLTNLNEIVLDRYKIVGGYVRFEGSVRNDIKDFKLKISSSLNGKSPGRENFLIWGAPGSGKSHLVHEIQKDIGPDITFVELNLAQSNESQFREKLEALERSEKRALCFVDEIDSKENETWPYETLIPYMEPSRKSNKRVCYVLAGSSGESMSDMKKKIASRPKGTDLLSRIFSYDEAVVPQLSVGDKILVSTAQMIGTSLRKGLHIREVEKLALYYLSVNPAFSSSRQLSGIATSSVERIPTGEDRIKYDYLFSPGDKENKDFWLSVQPAIDKLANKFVTVVSSSFSDAERKTERSRKRIAVLPLVSISPDPADEYFADGLTEELIDRICHVNELAVIARTSIMNYKNEKKKIGQIAEELKVDLILEGSVRKAGDRIRVTAQLINSKTEEHLWSERYDGDLKDVFEVQSSVAENVAKTLRLRFSGQSAATSEEIIDPETYTMFLRANQLVNEGSPDSLKEAKSFYEKVIERQPTFGRAYASLTILLLRLANFELESETAMRNIEATAQKSVDLDPDSSYSKLAMGIVHFQFDRVQQSEREIKEALRINPNYFEALIALSDLYWIEEKMEESITCLRAALSLNPLSSDAATTLADALRMTGRIDEALESLEKIKKIYPTSASLNHVYARCYLQTGDYDKAEAVLDAAEKHNPGTDTFSVERGMLYSLTGRRKEAENLLKELSKSSEYLFLFTTMVVRSNLGELTESFDALNRLNELHICPNNILVDPLFANLYRDPRFAEFRENYWSNANIEK